MPVQPTKLGPITRWLIRLFLERSGESLPAEERGSAYGLLEGYISVVLNTLLFALKGGLGLASGSVALIADAVHSLSDSVTSVVVIVGSYIARRPPDAEHPYGHGRAESVAAVVIAVLLATTGVGFSRASIERVLDPVPLTASWLAIGIVSATMLVKEWMARFSIALGRASANPALEADGWHHRSDVLSTLLVVGGMIGSRYDLAVLDGAVGIGVSLVLIKVAVDIGRKAFDSLLGRAPEADELAEVRRRAMEVDGVEGVHDVVIHHYGATCFYSLHVETSDQVSALQLHELTARVEERVANGHHGAVCVHADPINREHPEYQRLHRVVSEAVQADALARSFHDLRIVGGGDQLYVIFDVSLAEGRRGDWTAAQRRLARAVRSEFPGARVVVEADPLFAR